MSARPAGRTQACDRADAAQRLQQALKFMEAARLTAEDEEYTSVAASLAVLAGIAASDAACCVALGKRSRGQDHKLATSLIREVVPGGDEAAKRLDRLLALKDSAQYGVIHPSPGDLTSALRNAEALVGFAQIVAAR
jgi:hypothetical protein